MDDTVAGPGEDWEVLERLLPPGWQEQAKALGALRRCRKFASAELLLRVMLMHLVDGCSLRETAVRAAQGGLVGVSDVALLKRLKSCGPWFRWISGALLQAYVSPQPETLFGKDWRVRVIDGSVICEPGATGSTWRLHYSIGLPSLQCDEVHVSDPQVGESFKRFHVRPGELLIGDRGYAHRAGIAHVVARGGAVLVRLNLSNVPLAMPDGSALPLLERLCALRGTGVGDWATLIPMKPAPVLGRVCAVRKSATAAARARETLQRESTRKGHAMQPETWEAAGYVFVFTTLPETVPATAVLEMYRGRWQIELTFKRLKSLLALGHLKKTDPEGAQAWLQGKLMVAFLLEAMISAGERFFPWGYPLADIAPQPPLPVAGDGAHAASA